LSFNQTAIKIHAFPIAGGAEHREFFFLPYAHSFLPLGTSASKIRLYLELLESEFDFCDKRFLYGKIGRGFEKHVGIPRIALSRGAFLCELIRCLNVIFDSIYVWRFK
jgi:hypothetical protein